MKKMWSSIHVQWTSRFSFAASKDPCPRTSLIREKNILQPPLLPLQLHPRIQIPPLFVVRVIRHVLRRRPRPPWQQVHIVDVPVPLLSLFLSLHTIVIARDLFPFLRRQHRLWLQGELLWFQQRAHRQSIVMHRRHEPSLALDRVDRRRARPRHLDHQLTREALLPVSQQLHAVLHGAGGEHPRVHEVPNGDHAVRAFGHEASHRHEILHLPHVQGDELEPELGVLHLTDLWKAFVEFSLAALECGVDAASCAGLLALVASAAGLALR